MGCGKACFGRRGLKLENFCPGFYPQEFRPGTSNSSTKGPQMVLRRDLELWDYPFNDDESEEEEMCKGNYSRPRRKCPPATPMVSQKGSAA